MADIVVNDITPRNQYTAGGGGPTVFAYTFPIFANTDLLVFQTPAGATPNDVTQLLVYNVAYTVTNNVAPAVGGTITLTVGANVGDIITIVRDMPDNRLNNYIDGGLFQATTVNTDFDRTVMMSQQDKMYDRVIGIHYNNSSVVTPIRDNILPILPPNSVWQMNNAGTGIQAVTTFAGSGSVVVPSVTNKFAYTTNTLGTIASSIFTKPAADGTAGSSMTTDGAGNLGFTLITGGVLAWTVVTISGAMAINNGYLSNGAGLMTLTLPAVCAVGSIFRVANMNANGWLIAQNAGQSILIAALSTTAGAGGSLASTARGDSVEIVCIVANTTFLVLSSMGNITVV